MSADVRKEACDPDRLESFLNGDLSGPQEREFSLHLNTCEACRRSLEQRAAEPEAWMEAQTLLKPAKFDSFDAGGFSESGERSGQQPQIQTVLDALGPTDDPKMLGRLGGYEISGVVGAGGMGVADPLFAARRRAYQEQRKQIEAIAAHFAQSGFNFKTAVKDWVVSNFYRADGLATVASDPARRAELEDVGLVRMLAPEQVERKVAAIFGRPWGKMDEEIAVLYGGIDSKEVTERAADPSGAMGAIQRILSNDVACRETALDFSRPPAARRLFPDIETDCAPWHVARGGREDPPDDRVPAPARPGPLRCAGLSGVGTYFPALRRGRRGRRRAQGHRRAGELELPPGPARPRARPEIHGTRVACRADVPAAQAGVPI